MPEVYRKFGRTVRYEQGTFVRIEEGGEAVEDGRTFSCRPIERTQAVEPIDETEMRNVIAAIRSIMPVDIERLVLSDGVAKHEFGEVRWTERTRRLHVSLTHASHRAILDLGDYDFNIVASIAEALARCGGERDAPARIRLAPNVTAALLPSLVGVAPPNVRLLQTARGVDGKGAPVEERAIAGPQFPNWYRPSYRSRPVRAPLHIRAECEVTAMDENLPRAVALLAPADGLLVRALCVDGRAVYPATVRVARIDAVGPPLRWYPYGAGSFGSEMML